MAKAIKKTKKSSVKTGKMKSSTEMDFRNDDLAQMPYPEPAPSPARSNSKFIKIAIGVLVVVIIGALLARNRSWFIVATVNGAPISRMELNQKLAQRYGAQILDAIIGEKLVLAEAAKQNLQVSEAEINERVSGIEKSLNGQMKLADALKLQGVSEDEFKNQIKVQVIIDKLLGKEVSVSAQEVDDFVKSNPQMLTSSEPAKMRLEAEKDIKNTKIGAKFQEWFTKLRESAKVTKYL